MLKTKLSTAIALAAVLSLLLTPAAYAAGAGSTSGSFGALGQAPTVTLIQIYSNSGCTIVADSMDPYITEYWCKVSVDSANKLKHLNQVKATLFYNNTGDNTTAAPGISNTQTCAILTCTIAGPPGYIQTFSILPFGGTTWQLGTCTPPADLNANTGDWIFAFWPGKVATEATGLESPPCFWDAQGLATNRSSQTGELYLRGKYMNCYSEITVTGSVNWGDVPLGLTFENVANPQPASDNITITYIANGDYKSDIKSTNWESGGDNVTLSTGNPPGGSGEFALKAYSSDNLTAAVVVTTGYTPMDETGTITLDAGTPVSANRLWLALSTLGILPGTYTGTIWYQIECR